MRHSTKRRSRAGAWIGAALCALVASAPAFADYREEYAQGLKAAAAGKWSEVETRMRDAASEEPTPQVQARLYGQRFEPYVPLFFMGIAAYRRGDCAAAVQYLGNAPTQAVIRDGRAKRRLDDFIPIATKGLSECETKLAGNATSAPNATASNPPPSTTSPTTTSPPATTPTNPPATTPSTTVPIASNTPPSTTRPTPPPSPPTTRPTPPATTPATPPSTAPTATAPSAPALLASAVDNYLRGRYTQVASADPAQLTDARARFHALLLRAASRYTLAMMQGANAQLLAQAEADARAAKALNPAAPDAQLYSPRFRQFYAQVR